MVFVEYAVRKDSNFAVCHSPRYGGTLMDWTAEI